MRNDLIEGGERAPTMRKIRRIRENAGYPSLREQKGYRAIVVLAGVTPPPRSAGKRRTGERVAGSTEGEGMLARDALTNTPQRLLETGEPVAVKAARRVCAVRRFEILLLQAGGTKEMFLSYQLT